MLRSSIFSNVPRTNERSNESSLQITAKFNNHVLAA